MLTPIRPTKPRTTPPAPVARAPIALPSIPAVDPKAQWHAGYAAGRSTKWAFDTYEAWESVVWTLREVRDESQRLAPQSEASRLAAAIVKLAEEKMSAAVSAAKKAAP